MQLKVTFSERLRELMKSQRVTQVELAKKIGVTHPAIGKMLKGTIPRGDNLAKIAEVFRIPPSELLSDTASRGLSWGEPGVWHLVPIISWANAGHGINYIDQGSDVPKLMANCPDPNSYALEVTGQSMEPIYSEGDIIVCVPNYQAQVGDLVMVMTAGEEPLFKRYAGRRKGKLCFESYNPKIPMKEFDPDEVLKIHVIWSVTRFLKGKNF